MNVRYLQLCQKELFPNEISRTSDGLLLKGRQNSVLWQRCMAANSHSTFKKFPPEKFVLLLILATCQDKLNWELSRVLSDKLLSILSALLAWDTENRTIRMTLKYIKKMIWNKRKLTRDQILFAQQLLTPVCIGGLDIKHYVSITGKDFQREYTTHENIYYVKRKERSSDVENPFSL